MAVNCSCDAFIARSNGVILDLLQVLNGPYDGAQPAPAGTGAAIRLGHYDGAYGVRLASVMTQGDPSYPNEAFVLQTTYNSPTHVERLRVTADGKVGIGTADPKGRLHMLGTPLWADKTVPPHSEIGAATAYRLVLNGDEPGIILSGARGSGAEDSVLGLQIGDYGSGDIRPQLYYGGPKGFEIVEITPNASQVVGRRLMIDPSGSVIFRGPSPWADVLAYGAVADYPGSGSGGTDSTPWIQAAINAVAAAGGGTVILPAGNYKIVRSLAIPHKVRLVGFGAASRLYYVPATLPVHGTIQTSGTAVTGTGTQFLTDVRPGDTIMAGGQTKTVHSVTDGDHLTTVTPFSPDLGAGTPYTLRPGAMVFVGNPSSVAEGMSAAVESLLLHGQGGTQDPLLGENLIFISGAVSNLTHFLLQNCHLWETRYNAIQTYGGSGLRIIGCNLDNCANAGLWLDGGASDIMIERCILQNGARPKQGTGILVRRADAVLVVNCGVQQYQYGIDFQPTTDSDYNWHAIVGCAFDTSTYGAYIGRNAVEAFPRGIIFEGCWFGNNDYGLIAERADGLRVDGCSSVHNGGHGIWLDYNTRNAVIDACIITDNGHPAPNTKSGIKISNSASDIVISANRIGAAMAYPGGSQANQQYGIDIDAGTRVWIITNNHLLGNRTKGLNDASSGTQRVKANNLGEDTP